MILCIETSAEPASIALHTPHGVISRSFPNENKVNEPLADELALLLSGQHSPISLIIVGAGPGSYSGARVGLATAEAIALTHGCPVITVPSYHGIMEQEEYAVLGDARRGAYFIMKEAESLQDSIHLEVLEEEDLLKALPSLPKRLYTFENTEKLPLSAETIIKKVSSTAENLLYYWNAQAEDSQKKRLTSPKEILYLRPPNITKAKNPFL